MIIQGMTLEEIVRIVGSLNEELFEQTESNKHGIILEPLSLHYSCDASNVVYVEFLDQCIWDSDNDEREFWEYTNDWEPLGDFLKKQIKIWVDTIKMINM